MPYYHDLDSIDEQIINFYAEGNPTADYIADELQNSTEDVADRRRELVEEGYLKTDWYGAGTEYTPADR